GGGAAQGQRLVDLEPEACTGGPSGRARRGHPGGRVDLDVALVHRPAEKPADRGEPARQRMRPSAGGSGAVLGDFYAFRVTPVGGLGDPGERRFEVVGLDRVQDGLAAQESGELLEVAAVGVQGGGAELGPHHAPLEHFEVLQDGLFDTDLHQSLRLGHEFECITSRIAYYTTWLLLLNARKGGARVSPVRSQRSSFPGRV